MTTMPEHITALAKVDALSLARYESMCQAIAECHRVDEVKDIRDKARALEMYASQAMNMDAERKAAEIRLRAERKAGELLSEMKKAQGARGSGSNQHEVRSHAATAPTLDEIGVSKTQSSKWQQLARVPEETFEQALRDPEKKPTTAGIITAVNGATRMDEDALWIWGRARDFERMQLAERHPTEVFGGMTDTMQADMRRIVPTMIQWLTQVMGGAQE